jgi:hypothetical protein
MQIYKEVELYENCKIVRITASAESKGHKYLNYDLTSLLRHW